MEKNSVILIQLIISCLTLILTPLFSALIVNYRLKKSHTYWEKQQGFLKDLEIDKLKASTYRESVVSTNKLNDKILHHHIYASKRDILQALSNVLKANNPNESDTFLRLFETAKTTAEESYLNMREASIFYSGIGVSIRLYFSEEIFKKYSALQIKFKTLQNNLISISKLEKIALDLISKEVSVEDLQEKLRGIYFEEYDRQKCDNEIHKFLDALMIEFRK
ncbi:hypothetical protein LVD15_18965 [Fulvivirga maritima]|uniref:hypothetical protein n=1 Tax=Fulvivirga maritima TaxID=2904247 RepID=UPI001F3C910B|nr:hypothetical protein [Fulvivirga maritima]UII25367.1 hypothetical protein LVD15_18965 [Fulvivirga maritima]